MSRLRPPDIRGPRLRRSWLWYPGVGLAYFLLSSLTLVAFERTSFVVAMFPASGLALAAMLLTPARRRPWLALAIAVADFSADQAFGKPFLLAHLLFAPVMALEGWLAATLYGRLRRRGEGQPGAQLGLPELGTLFAACLVGTAVCGLLGATVQYPIFRTPLGTAFWEWWVPDLVACLTLTPALLFTADRLVARRPLRPWRFLEGVALMLGFLGALWQVFRPGASPSHVSLTVVVLPFLVWAALRLGPLGTAWICLALTGFSVLATSLGHGPFVLASSSPFNQILWSQVFSLVVGLAMMVLALALHERHTTTLALEGALADLQASVARTQAFFQETPDPIAMVDADLRLVAYNPPLATLWQAALDRPPVLGEPVLDLGAGPGAEAGAPWRRALGGEHVRVPLDLAGRPFEASFAPLHSAQGAVIGVALTLWSVTELHERHLAAARSQRLESMGRLAGGVAHDFNNIVTAILGYGDLLSARVEGQTEASHYAQEIIRASNRAGVLTQQLLAFARRQVMEPRLVDPNRLIDDLAPMLTRLLDAQVHFSWTGLEGAWPVLVDPGQLEQALVNLAVNARDAMPGGGKLTMETNNVHLDRLHAHRREVPPGELYLQISVSDTGQGMPAEVLERIFEPFYTTKEGKGTGLGLSTVEGSIRQAGGAVLVYSEPGVGSVFKLLLPRARGQAQANAVKAEARPRPGQERVLVVEDDDVLRGLSSRILEAQGYTTLALSTGEEALALDDTELRGFHLLLTDIVLPGLHGHALAEALLTRHPALRVLYVSGYTENSVIRMGVLQTGVQFLAKPYAAAKLLASVAAVLDLPQ